MSNSVLFVDTTILCNLLKVPMKCQHSAETTAELKSYTLAGAVMVLPIAAVIETGNFIAQLSSGHERRTVAYTFAQVLGSIVAGDAPWEPHEFAWDRRYIERVVAGGRTGDDLVGLMASANIGTGDLSILVERDMYRERTGIANVRIWTRDDRLNAYND